MAAGTIKTKAQLVTDIDSNIVAGGNIDAVTLNGILQNVVASYEDIIRDYTTVQRDALTPVESQIIYNTTSNRLEYYSASMWLPCSQKETIAVDCSANPNYPEALCGDQYIVTVAGKIGGGSGADVHVGDLVTCTVANAGGTQAGVGSSWKVTYSADSTTITVKTVTKTFTAAEINGCYVTPVLFIPLVTGKTIQLLNGNYKSTYVSSDYVVTTGNNIHLGCNPATAQLSLDVEFSASVYRPLATPAAIYDNPLVVSNDIYLYSFTAISGGDSPITITAFYVEL